MKIQCEQCKIEYNIDDASIGDRGIRAQCPRCNHITTIRKSQSAIMDQARAKLDMAICVNCGKPTEPNPNDPIPICANCQAMTSNTGDLGVRTTVGGAQGIGAQGVPMGGPPPRMPNIPAAPPPPAAAYVPPQMNTAMPSTEPIQWRVKKSPGGDIYGPFDRELIGGWIETEKIVPGDEISRVGGAWKAAGEHEDFSVMFAKRYPIAPSASAPLEADRPTARPSTTGVRSGSTKSARREPMPVGVIVGISIAVLMIGTVGGLFVQGIFTVPDFSRPTPVQVADATDKRLDAIREEFPGITGTAPEHQSAGQTAMLSDTVEGYAMARKEFLQALALDRADYVSMAQLAEVDALLGRYDQQTGLLEESFRFAGRVVERAADNPLSHRAKAAALLGSPNPSNNSAARALIETQVLTKAPDDPIGTTMLAIALRGTDDAKAEELLKKAMGTAPELIRPRLELGMLYESQRRYQKSLETFKPIAGRSFLASFRTGEIEVEVGNYKEAATAFRQAAKVSESGGGRPYVDATISAAVIQYQALGNAKEANVLLNGLENRYLSDKATEKLRPDQANRLRLHLAILARLGGQLDRSLLLSQKVIDDREADLTPAAHFNSALVRLRKADFDAADKHFEEADAPNLIDREKSEVYYWHALLRVRRGDVPGAGAKYDDSVREDPHNWKAVVGNALLLVDTLDRQIEGLDKLQELARNDPEFYDQYQQVTLFFPDPTKDLLLNATTTFKKVYAAQETDPRAASALGILAFLGNRKGEAERYFAAALSEQSPDPAAFIFSGLLAEARGDKANLAKALDRYNTVKSNAASPFLSMAIGRVETKMGSYDKAVSDLQDALSRSPDYAPAHFWLGECYRRRGEKRQAIAKWADALKYDPNYLRASRAILEQDS